MRAFVAIVIAVAAGAVSAFVPSSRAVRSSVTMSAVEGRRDFFVKAAAAAAAMAPVAAFADRDYDGIKYLGGGETIDLNNANIRAYLKMPGMYPGAAGKITSNRVPLTKVSDVYGIKGLTEGEKAAIKKYESRFTVLPVKAEYYIDRTNNGLYR